MRKTLIYVVSLLVCLGLAGAVWAGKGGKKTTPVGLIPVTVTFRDSGSTPVDLIRSDRMGTYTDGVDGVQATISSDPNPGRLWLRTGKEGRRLILNFDFPETQDDSGNVVLIGADCTDTDRFPSIQVIGVTPLEDCFTVATLSLFQEYGYDGMCCLVPLDRRLNLLAMPVGSTAYVSFTIAFPAKVKNKTNRLGFGIFTAPDSPGTVTRVAKGTWTLEAVEPLFDNKGKITGTQFSVAELTEPTKGERRSPTGIGPLPFHVTVVCIDANGQPDDTLCPVRAQ